MSNKVNFTKEHKDTLTTLLAKWLLKGYTVKGVLNTELNVFELMHNTTINTLLSILGNLKKEVERLENLDEWSANESQQRKLTRLKEAKDLVNLIIGYKRYQEQLKTDRARLAELRANLVELEASTKTPEDKIKEIREQLASYTDIEQDLED